MFGVLHLLRLPRRLRPSSAIGNSGSDNNSPVTYFSHARVCLLVSIVNWTQNRLTWEESLIVWPFGSGWLVGIPMEDIITAILAISCCGKIQPQRGWYQSRSLGPECLKTRAIELACSHFSTTARYDQQFEFLIDMPTMMGYHRELWATWAFLCKSAFFGGILSLQQKRNQDPCHLKNCIQL